MTEPIRVSDLPRDDEDVLPAVSHGGLIVGAVMAALSSVTVAMLVAYLVGGA